MNVYFYNPCYLNAEKFPILAEILKVKQVIDLTAPNTRNNELVKYYQPIAIYIRQEADVEQSIRDAVYKFNEPICKPKIENGKFTGGFIVNDLYKNSNAYNPIYNLEKCNDENVLILFETKERVPLYFTSFALNILKKYAQRFSYNEKLCFNIIDSFFERSATFYRQRFYKLQRAITALSSKDFHNNQIESYKSYNFSRIKTMDIDYSLIEDFNKHIYNPLLSYLYTKLKCKYLYNEYNISLADYFLNEKGEKELFEIRNKYFISKIRKNSYKRYNDDLYDNIEESEVEAWGADAELKYIRTNGGDWIDD